MKREDMNALRMEDQLARLSDIVIILVESAGTCTELGAFSLSEELRPKILPVLDQQFEADSSFISTGPINWINEESLYGPAIYADFEVLLRSAGEIDKRIARIPGPARTREEEVTNLAERPKHFLFFLCDLLAIIGPAPYSHCEYYVNQVFTKGAGEWSLPSLIGLAESLGLLARVEGGECGPLFYRPLIDGRLESFQAPKKMFELSEERARLISVYQLIPPLRDLLHKGVLGAVQ